MLGRMSNLLCNRKNKYVGIFILVTAINFFLQYKIQFSKEVRTSWREVYIKPFSWMDVIVGLGILVLICVGTYLFVNKGYCVIEKLFHKFYDVRVKAFTPKKTYLIILAVWGFFLLVFYPGTAMNDTIFILEDPIALSNQHPIIYNLLTYAFYQLGCLCGHPNWGLCCISILQITTMDYVLVRGIFYGKRKGFPDFLCVLLALYFAFAPLYFTYAFSAIKDTPFSICLFLFILLLLEWKDEEGNCIHSFRYFTELFISVFGILSFRNNGILIIIGMAIVLWLQQKYKSRKYEIIGILVGTMLLQKMLCGILMPGSVDEYFQEKIGIPLQQVAASVVKGNALTTEQEEYLYRLLPKEEWQVYAPGCADNLKWNEAFDREYLNQTKGDFIKIWGQLLLQNPREYVEAYILATYGMWGIETRNKEQVYFRRIYENDLGLKMQSPLPHVLHAVFYQYYCSRIAYGYLSIGTTIWLLFAVTLWLLFKRRYDTLLVTVPLWILWLSLLLATPIAFAFRYGFIFAMTVPFYIFIPLCCRDVPFATRMCTLS